MAILGWAAFGVGVRMWQLGIEMRPLFERRAAIGYPIFASIAAAFGYYLEGVEDRQRQILEERKARLLEKRARHAVAAAADDSGAVPV